MSSKTVQIKVFGRYQVVDEIGRGGMGIVYRGYDPVIGRTVALKTIVFDTNDSQSRDLRARLHREACAAGTLGHPNIVTVHDVVESDGVTALAMEFIEGRDLAATIAERAPLPFDEAVAIFEQLCSALDFAGAHGIIHRDIKPANILVAPDGRAKVTDFGVARMAQSNLTLAGTILGSPSYMSPEQVRGRTLDGRSDLFSAAIVLYEMLTKERPFGGGSDVTTTLYRIVNDPPLPAGQFNPLLGDALTGVFERAFAKEPDARFATGAEMVAAVRRALSIRTPVSVPGGATPALPVAVPAPVPASGPAKTVAVPVPAAEAPKAPSVSDAAGGASKTVVVPVPMAAHAGAVAVSTPPAGFRVTMPVLVGAGLVVLIALASAGWLAFRRETAPDAASQPAADAARVASTPVPGPPSHGASSSTTPTVRATQPGAATPGGGPAGSPAKRPGAGRAPVDATAYDMNDVDVKPSVLSSPAPEYPPDARRRRQEDTVVLSVLVSETGRPLEVKVLRKAKKVPAFDTAAVAAVRGWTFKPARRQGKAVRCWYSVGVPFQLRR